MRITGVGSLPHVDPAAAARFVLATCDVPYLPQLPRRHREEGMLRQWGDGLAGLGAADDELGLRHGAPAGPREEAFVGAEVALELFRAAGVREVKTQATGPITLAFAALAAGRGPDGLWEAIVPGLAERIEDHLAAVRRALPGATVHLVVDEPSLVAFAPGARRGPLDPEAAFAALARLLGALDVPAGVHCCGDTAWARLLGLGPSRLSIDVRTPGLLAEAPAFASAVAGGVVPVWGLVPVEPSPDPSDRLGRYRTVVSALVVEGAPHAALTGDAWATPTCGLAGVTPKAAAVIMEELRRRVEGLDGR